MKPPHSNRPPTVVYVQKPALKRRGSPILSGWIVLIFGFVVACIPILGFAAYAIGGFLCFAAFVLSIIGMANGRAMGGIALMLAAVIAAPIAYAITPIVSSFFGLAAPAVVEGFKEGMSQPEKKTTPVQQRAPEDGKPLPEGWVPGPAAK